MAIRQIKMENGESKWEVYVCIRGRGSRRLRRRFKRKSDAEAFLLDFKARRRGNSSRIDFEETNFKAEAQYWLKCKYERLSPGHLKRAEGVLKALLPALGRRNPKDFTPGFLTQIQSDLLAAGSKPATVNRKLEIVTSILRFSVRHQRIPYDPTSGFEKLRVNRDEMKFWELSEAQYFLTFADRKYPMGAKDRWKYVVYLLVINGGLRAAEVWGLKAKDLAFDGELIVIQRSWNRIRKEFRSTKGKTNRRIPCNPLLSCELKSILNERNLKPEDLVFRSENNTAIDHDNFRKRVFNVDAEEAKMRPIRFHDLRHTAITLLVSGGVDLVTVQAIAGHKDIHTTMGYTHVIADNIRKVAKTFSITPNNADSKPDLRLVHSV